MRLLVSGGGSAGHVLPALAVLDQLSDEAEVLYVGSHSGPDASLVGKKYAYRGIFTGKLRRYGGLSVFHPWLILRNIGDGCLLLLGTVQALWICWRFKPDVVFCNGGFTSIPVALASAVFHRPILIQEADQTFGIANSILRKVAGKIAVAYAGQDHDSRVVVTGNPIRKDLLEDADKPLPKEFALDESLPLVLVMGGTKGAQRINKAIFAGLVQLLDRANVVHLTGAVDIDAADAMRARLSKSQQSRYFPRIFLEEGYPQLLAKATIVITRGGAGSLWEAALLKKAMIIVPITHSANDHQRKNAEYFVSRGAAEILSETELEKGHLVPRALELLANPAERSEMGERAAHSIAPDGAAKVAALLKKMAFDSSQT